MSPFEKTLSVEVPKAVAKGLGLEDNVSITAVGSVKELDTFSFGEGPVAVGDKSPKKGEEKVRIRIKLSAPVKIKKSGAARKAFDKAMDEKDKAEKE